MGSVFAGYRIERVLGTGGMGNVYLVRNPDLPRSEALKVLATELSRDPDFRARFIREADVAAGLDHPNIVSVHQRGQFEGQLWMTMQFVDGVNAEDAQRAGMMPAARAVHVVGEIAKALDYAHARGVVHRDVKPANFLLSGTIGRDERVLLGDFGIARALDDAGLTSTGAVLATLSYAAPEVLAGQAFDGRADLYSLGCALFRLLTGATPFSSGGGAAAVVAGHLFQPPPRVSDRAQGLTSAMDMVVAIAMAKEPARRFGSARELADAAAAALHADAKIGWAQANLAPRGIHTGSGASSPWSKNPRGPATVMATPSVHGSSPRLPGVQSRRHRRVLAAAAGGIVAVAAAIGVIITAHNPRAAAPATTTALGPTTTVTSTTARPRPPIVTPARLPDLLAPLDDVKNYMGIQNLVAQQPTLQPSENPNGPIDRKECRPTLGGGAPNSYDMQGIIGYYSLLINEPRNGTPLQGAGQVVVAFRDADAAEQQLANSVAIWRKCGGSTMTLPGTPRNVPVSMSVPDTTANGITTMVLKVQGPAIRARDDRAIAAKNNVLVDVSVNMVNSDRGQQAVLDITNSVLRNIPD